MKNVDDIINALLELESIKLWSLIMTILGDLDGESLTGKDLRSYMEPLGIKPEATRVALHRLKKDGWINSQKNGREVTYALSKLGHKETRAVYNDVYGIDVKYPEGWQLGVTGTSGVEIKPESPIIKLDKSLVLMPKRLQSKFPEFMEVNIPENDLPDWFLSKFLSLETIHLADQLNEYLVLYKSQEAQSNSLQKMLVRLLFLHHWRKMALRTNCWAHIGLLPDGAIAKYHKSITRLLSDTDKLRPAP